MSNPNVAPINANDGKQLDLVAVIAAIACITSVGIALGLSFPLLSILMAMRGFSSTSIGANAAIGAIAGIAVIPFITPITRRLGLVNTLTLASLICSACLAGFYFLDSFLSWFVLRFFLHVAITFSFVLSEFWINASVPDARRGFFLAMYATVLSVGFACGPAILALVGSAGFAPFAISIFLVALSTLPALCARKSQPVFEQGQAGASILRFVLLVPSATFAAFIFGFVEQAAAALFPVFALDSGYDEKAIAWFLIALGTGNIVSQLPLGMLADKMANKGYTRRPILIFCATTGLLGACLFPWIAFHPVALAAMLFIWGGVATGLYTVGLAHLGARVHGNHALVQANAAFILCYMIGMLFGPQLVGIAMDQFPPFGISWSIAIAFAAYTVFGILNLFRPQAEIRE